MSNNLALKVTADISDATAKLAVLNAEFKTTQTQINALARAGAAGNLDAGGAAQLQQLTARSLELQAAAQPLAVAVKDAGFAVSGLGASAARAAEEVGASHGQISVATREFRALFDELSSGRTRYTPGTLAIIANKVFDLQASTLLAAGGVAALAGGIAYLAYQAIETSRQMDTLAESARFFGNLDASAGTVRQLVEVMVQLGDISRSDATDIAGTFERISGLSQGTMEALAGSVSNVAQMMGVSADKAAELLAKHFELGASATSLAEQFHDLTPAQLDAARAADASGNADAVAAEKVTILREANEGLIDSLKKKLSELEEAKSHLADNAEAVNAGLLPEQMDEADQAIGRVKQQIDALSGSMKALDSNAPSDVLKNAVGEALKSDSKLHERTDITTQINTYMQARAEAIREGNKTDLAILDQAIADERKKLAELDGVKAPRRQSGPNLSEQVDTSMLEEQQRIANALPQLMQQANDQELAIEQQHASAVEQIHRIELDTKKQVLDAEVTAGKVSSAQALATEKQLTADLYAEDIKRLQNELATLDPGTAAYVHMSDQIRTMKAQEAQELAGYDAKIAENAKQTADKQVQAYQKALAPISGAISTSINGIIQGTQTAQQAVGKMLESILEKYISVAVKTTVNWIAQEAHKTAVTLASEQARTAATTAGETTRLAAKTTATAQGNALESASNLKEIGSAAATGAAKAYQAMVGIPYIGPFIAPAAAAVAFAGIAAFKGLASFDQGAFNLPQDMVAQVHAGETILPRPFADSFRQAVSGGGGMGGGDTHHYHIHATDSASFEQMLNRNPKALAAGMRKVVRNGLV